MLAPTQAGTARGSSALVWKTQSWSLELSETISPRLLMALLHHANGGSLRVLVGHIECETGGVQEAMGNHTREVSACGRATTAFIDHNSTMVPGVDPADVPKELPQTVKARDPEALALAEWAVDDVWVNLHGDHPDDSVSGFTFPALQKRINRVHLSSELLSCVCSVYTVCISSGGSDRCP